MKLFAVLTIVMIGIAAGLVSLVGSKTAGLKPFVYEQATAQEQQDWLSRQAQLYRRDLAGTLPSGWGTAPHLVVKDIQTNRLNRSIRFHIEATEPAQLVANASNIGQRWLKQACLKFIHSSLYRVRVTIVDSFHLMNGRQAFKAVISPERCDAIYPPLGYKKKQG